MSITIDDIHRFHQFAIAKVEQSTQSDLTMDDLLVEWDSISNRQSINEAIHRGVADVEAGRTRPVEEVSAELRAKYKLDQ